MSNCIEIHTDTFIPWEQISEPQMLLAHLQAAETDPQGKSFNHSYSNHHFAWYLPLDAIEVEKDGIAFLWGYGNSGHTERDFKGLIYSLSAYLLPNVHIVAEVSNEFDNFETRYIMDILASDPWGLA